MASLAWLVVLGAGDAIVAYLASTQPMAAWAGTEDAEPDDSQTKPGEPDCPNPDNGDGGNDCTDQGNSEIEEDQEVMGDPVIISSGEYVKQQYDIRRKVHGQWISVIRYYRNQSSINQNFGHKWDSNLMARVEDTGDVRVYVEGEMPVLFTRPSGDSGGGGGEGDPVLDEEYMGPSGTSLNGGDGEPYFYTALNGDTYTFDSTGQILTKELRTGHTFVWDYDSTGEYVQALQDGDENDIYQFEYDEDLITKVKDVVGNRSVTYEYDTSGRLTRVSGSCGTCGTLPEQRFEYDVDHNLVTVRNADNQVTLTNEYDGEERVTKQTKGGTAEASYDYSNYEDLHYIYVNYADVTHHHHIDSAFNLTKHEVEGQARGTAATYTTTYHYDSTSGGLTRTTHPTGRSVQTLRADNGKQSSYVLHDATSPITMREYQWGDYGNATRVTHAPGTGEEYVVDHVYDAQGSLLTQTTDPGGLAIVETWAYNGYGQRTRHVDAEGTITTWAYDADGYLTQQVRDVGGLALTESYEVDALGQVTKRTNPRGKIWQYAYNAAGRVTRTVEPTGRTILNVYDNRANLVTRTERDSEVSPDITRTSVYHYDHLDNLTRLSLPAPGGGQRHFDFAYDGEDRRTYAKLPTGEETFYSFDELDRVFEERMYDAANNVTVTRATYWYDGEGNLTRQADGNGNDVLKARDYDSYGYLTREVDALDHDVVYENDALGQVTRQVRRDSQATAVAESRFAYDIVGRLTAERTLSDPGGTESTADALVELFYDQADRLTRERTHLTATEAMDEDTYFDAVGRITRLDADDAPPIDLAYDDAGNLLTRVVDPGTLAITTTFAHDSAGLVTRTTQPDDTYQVNVYDGLGRLTKRSQHASAGTAFAVVEVLYDDDLNTATRAYLYADPANQSAFDAQTDPSQAALYDANGRLTATEDAHGHTTSFAYDDLGRQTETTDPADNQQVVVYDDADRVLTQLQLDYDGANHVTFATAMEYDDLGRVTRRIEQGPDGDLAATTDNLTSTLWYDALGQVTQQEDPSGQVTAMHHDALGRLTRTTEDVNGLARHTDRAYDRAGRLLTLTGYPDGTTGAQETVYAYAKSGVLTRTTYPDDSGGGGERGFVAFHFDSVLRLTRQNHQDDTNTDTVYDAMGRRLTVTRGSEIDSFTWTDAGQLASAKRGTSGTPDAVSEVERLYDDLLRLTRERQTVKQGTTRNVDYDYDLGGNLVTRTYPDATSFSYSYTDVDQLDTLKRGGTTLASYSYVGGRPGELELPTGTAHAVVQSHTYDGMARLTRLAQSRDGTELATFAHGYDTVGNLTSRTFEHMSGDPSEEYAYDSLYRLTRTEFGHRSGDPYEGFVYDDLGNHLTQNHDGTTLAGDFNDVNEQTERDSETLDWDLRGNLTEDDEDQQYAYDRSNLLTEVRDDQDNVIATYAYDALGRRIEKEVTGGDTTKFYYDGNRLIEERDDTGALQRQYVWGGIYIDELLLFTDVIGEGGTADADLLVLRHHNFNVVALVDRDTGDVVERYDYNPYGTRTVLNADFTTHSDAVAGSFAFAIGHQGLLHDHESGLVYNRARMLHPVLGWFVQRDPLQYIDGMSLYQYIRSMPNVNLDPLGLRSPDRNQWWEFHRREERMNRQLSRLGDWLAARRQCGSEPLGPRVDDDQKCRWAKCMRDYFDKALSNANKIVPEVDEKLTNAAQALAAEVGEFSNISDGRREAIVNGIWLFAGMVGGKVDPRAGLAASGIQAGRGFVVGDHASGASNLVLGMAGWEASRRGASFARTGVWSIAGYLGGTGIDILNRQLINNWIDGVNDEMQADHFRDTWRRLEQFRRWSDRLNNRKISFEKSLDEHSDAVERWCCD